MAHLKVGDPAPDFEAVTDTGDKVKLSDYRGKQVILYFYPADDTSGCTLQACNFRDNYTTIEAKNAVVLGVSPDGVKSHQKFKDKYGLPFPLLVDEDHSISDTYGAWGEKTNSQGNKYMGVIRTHYVIDEQGRIADVQYNVKAADSLPEAMRVLA